MSIFAFMRRSKPAPTQPLPEILSNPVALAEVAFPPTRPVRAVRPVRPKPPKASATAKARRRAQRLARRRNRA